MASSIGKDEGRCVRFESTQHKRGVNCVRADFRNFLRTGFGTISEDVCDWTKNTV